MLVNCTISASAYGTERFALIQNYTGTPTRPDRRGYSQSLFNLEMFHIDKCAQREDLGLKILSLIQMST